MFSLPWARSRLPFLIPLWKPQQLPTHLISFPDSVDDTSDHFATITTWQIPHKSLPRWNLNKANWLQFTKLLEDWATRCTPATELQLLMRLLRRLSLSTTISHSLKNSWFYSARIWDLKYRMHLLRNLRKKTNSHTFMIPSEPSDT